MVRCPNCNDELGTATRCKACGTSVEQPEDSQSHGRQTPPHRQTENDQSRSSRRRTPSSRESQRTRHSQGRGLPKGLKLLAAALAVFGVGSLFGAVTLDQVTRRAAVYGPAAGSMGLADFAVVFAALGVADLAAAYGLWTRQSWGWTVGMAALGTGVLSGLLVVANGSAGTGLVSTLLYGGLGWYLYDHRWVYAAGNQRNSRGTRPPADERRSSR